MAERRLYSTSGQQSANTNPAKETRSPLRLVGNSSHPNIGINSADPLYCAKTASAMKAQGLDGCLLDWYGQGHNSDNSLLVLKPELEKRGLVFALCVDGGMHSISTATTDEARTAALLAAIAYARTHYINSPAYLRDQGKPIILFFGFSTADFDWTKIRSALADCKLIFRWEFRPTQYSNRSYADGYFGWTDNTEEWIANVKAKAPGKLIFLRINAYFDNTVEGLPVRCTWGVGKEKVIKSEGGLRLQRQLALAALHPEILYTSFNTWNDYQEGSALEPGIATGLSLFPKIVANELEWNDLNPLFDHYNVYISKDGENLMPLTRGTTVAVDLAALEIPCGSWVFVVEAVGKPFIQNIVESTSGSLAWA
jgi:hypothetical protein